MFGKLAIGCVARVPCYKPSPTCHSLRKPRANSAPSATSADGVFHINSNATIGVAFALTGWNRRPGTPRGLTPQHLLFEKVPCGASVIPETKSASRLDPNAHNAAFPMLKRCPKRCQRVHGSVGRARVGARSNYQPLTISALGWL